VKGFKRFKCGLFNTKKVTKKMTSNNDLVKNFLNGRHSTASSRNANRMEIKEKENHTIIEGYGHALYCLKTGGTVVLFDDWYGYSKTTSSHLNLIRRKANADKHINLVEDKTVKEPKAYRSQSVMEEMKCDFCESQVTTKQNRQNGLRVCDKNRCNREMATGV
jgi:hypothetical protein